MSSSPSVQLNWKNILIAAVLIGAVATTVYVTQSSTAGSQRKLKKKKTRKSDASLEQVVPEAVAGEVVSDAKATVKVVGANRVFGIVTIRPRNKLWRQKMLETSSTAKRSFKRL